MAKHLTFFTICILSHSALCSEKIKDPSINTDFMTFKEKLLYWSFRTTRLHSLAQQKSPEALRELQELLADPRVENVNPRDRGGFTPLHDAIQYNNIEAVRMLLGHPRIQVTTQAWGYTPILCAAKKLEILRLFKEYSKLTEETLNATYEQATSTSSKLDLEKLKASLRKLGVIQGPFAL